MKKCSNKEHKGADAIIYCCECRIYLCNKCEKLHSDLFQDSHQQKIIKDINVDEMFSGICKE